MKQTIIKLAAILLVFQLGFSSYAIAFSDGNNSRTILKGTIREDVKNYSTGIGVIGLRFIHQLGYPTYIEEVYPNSPAKRAGLIKNDLIISIDGMRTDTLNSDSVYQLLSGNPGSKVKISFARNESIFDVELTREDLATLSPEIQNKYLIGPISIPFDIRKVLDFKK